MSNAASREAAPAELIRLEVSAHDAKLRLDHLLAARIGDRTRSQLQRLIKEGSARVGDKQGRASTVVQAGDVVTLEIPPPQTPCYVSTHACNGKLKKALKKNGFSLTIQDGFGRKWESLLAQRV